jgi:CRISPR-associated protein Csx3
MESSGWTGKVFEEDKVKMFERQRQKPEPEVKFAVQEAEDFTLIRFWIENGPIKPENLKNINPPQAKATRGVILSGSGPVWLFLALAKHYHHTCWIAIAIDDPYPDGAVVVESHLGSVKVGDVICTGNSCH